MEQALQQFWAALLTLVLTGAGALALTGTRLILAKIAETRSNMTHDQLFMLDTFVEWAIKAAEQMGIIGLLEATGEAKKAWVIEQAQNFIDAHGLKIDVAVIESMIESKILEGIHLGLKGSPDPAPAEPTPAPDAPKA